VAIATAAVPAPRGALTAAAAAAAAGLQAVATAAAGAAAGLPVEASEAVAVAAGHPEAVLAAEAAAGLREVEADLQADVPADGATCKPASHPISKKHFP